MQIESSMSYRNRCSQCLLPENYPGIEFNENRVCNYCITYEKKKKRGSTFLKDRYRAWMEGIISRTKKKNKGKYDCLLCYSGGKDSTYLLYLLTQEYGLNVLAYTCDNEFLSEVAKRNIERTLSRLNVDHVWRRLGEDFYTRLFSTAFKDILTNPSKKPCRGHVCTQCAKVTNFYAQKIAVEMDIPLLVYGFAPQQLRAPHRRLSLALPKYGGVLSSLFNRFCYSLGIRERFCFTLNDIEKRELNLPLWDLRKLPRLLIPFYALDYDMPKIEEKVLNLDLIAAGDENPLSSNCQANLLIIDLDYRKFGYNPYLREFSQLVREGNLDRQEWLARFDEADQKIEAGTWEQEKIAFVLKRLGLTGYYQEYVTKWR